MFYEVFQMQISLDSIYLTTGVPNILSRLFYTGKQYVLERPSLNNLANQGRLIESPTNLNKSKLLLAEKILVMKMTHNVISDYRFHYLALHAGKKFSDYSQLSLKHIWPSLKISLGHKTTYDLCTFYIVNCLLITNFLALLKIGMKMNFMY